jgi:hypothetical protein
MRRWWVSLLGAVVLSGASVAVNLATDWKTNLWAWLAVVVLTVAGAGTTVWLYRVDQADSRTGERAVVAGGSIGTAVTGDRAHLTGPATAVPDRAAAPGTPVPTAPGPRSVVAGGDVGLAITGDDAQVDRGRGA